MGWTHDYRDVSRDRRANGARNITGTTAPDHRPGDSGLGIPHILRRRARWVGARLRHTRSG
ncbi:hypothetical protein ABZ883_34150 [Streptomyces sp. NPDC046977]|uniref:hypothetical protein n=1 Tax=Streptomyces sp. NPDC046977 TaxID=3154703 RepID=UPI0033E90F8E